MRYAVVLLLLGLAGCAGTTTPVVVANPVVTTPGTTADTIAKQIKAACAIDKVQSVFPHVCADPGRYANDVVIAGQVVRFAVTFLH